MFWWSNNCWGSTLHKVMGENTKSTSQDFIDFAIKNALKNYFFFTNLSQVSVIFIYYCLILLYLQDFELKQQKQILKISFQFSMSFHSKIYEILAWVFCIFPITLVKADPQQRFWPPKHPKLKLSKIPYFLTKNSGGFRRKLEKTRGFKFFSTGSHLKKWKFFLFPMIWLYPVLFIINSRLQKCNLFACTSRMNNSRLSKQTIPMSDIWIVSSMSCSDASTMRAENQSSSIVERRRFFMIRTLLMERSALTLVTANETRIL